MNRHVTQLCRILPLKYKIIYVSISFSLSSSVGCRDLLEVVQEHAVFERPSMLLLSVSAGASSLHFLAIHVYFLFLYNFWQHPQLSMCHTSGPFSCSSSLDNERCSDCFAKFVQLDVAHLFKLVLRFLAEHIGYAFFFHVLWTCRGIRLAVLQPNFASRSFAPRL